jgi:hypothetical protein
VSLFPAVSVLVWVHVFVGLSHEPPSLVHICSETDAATAPVAPKANNDIDPSNIKVVGDFVRMYSSLIATKPHFSRVPGERNQTRADHIWTGCGLAKARL